MKSKTIALILSIVGGLWGLDRFYLGYTRVGVLKLLTSGCCGILYLIDILQIAVGKLQPADGSPYNENIRLPQFKNRSNISCSDELEKLAKLHKKGILTEEEFAKAKKDVLDKN